MELTKNGLSPFGAASSGHPVAQCGNAKYEQIKNIKTIATYRFNALIQSSIYH